MELNKVKPLFAHDVGVSITIKSEKTKRGAIKKEPFTELIFIDSIGKQIISRIVIPFGTLKALPLLIEDNIKKTKKEIKNKEFPKKLKIETKSANTSSYLG